MSDAVISTLLSHIPMAIALVAGMAFVALTAWRPALGCALFVPLISLTTGLGRGTVIPVLRPNEAFLLMLLIGVVLHYLPRPRRRPITTLDLGIGTFVIGTVLIAGLVLLVTDPGELRNMDTVRSLVAPVQFLLVFLIFSRTDLSTPGVRAVLNLAMLASVVVGLLAIAEQVNLPGARDFVQTFYPPPPTDYGTWDPAFRPTSTLGHFSAVGAFGTLNYTLALALATQRHPGFSRAWLCLVMIVNLAALVASLTLAPLLVLPLASGMVLLHGRRIPRELGVTVVALAAAFLLLWPFVSARGAEQGILANTGGGITIPNTFEIRMRFWQAFFIPALEDHMWFGTGTVIPSAVPTRLLGFVDNEYLRQGFRAGVVGIALLVLMLLTVGVVGWRARGSPDVTRRSLGGTVVALVVFFALVGMTAEYLFFGGVSQEYAILIGVFAATQPAQALAPGLAAVQQPPKVVWAAASSAAE
jgi:hypothetical protein